MPHTGPTQLTAWGFGKIDQDLTLLRECAREMLEEIGEPELAALLQPSLPPPTHPLPPRGAQVISLLFQLLNLAEENTANQVLRLREAGNTGAGTQRLGLWTDSLVRLREAGWNSAQLAEAVEGTTVEPVFTAHPTEARRWSVLSLHRRIHHLLVELENRMYTNAERSRLRDEIKTALESLWRTGEILVEKPRVDSERTNILYYLENQVPPALRLLDARFEQAWKDAGISLPTAASGRLPAPAIRFGTWIGGDRDGHPLVTADVTRETLSELRTHALRVLDREMAGLQERLVLSGHLQPLPDSLAAAIALHDPAAPGRLAGDEEPWAGVVRILRDRLAGQATPAYRFPSELHRDLVALAGALRSVRADRLADGLVQPVLRTLDVLGFHLAAVDIRQNSAFHDRAIAQLLAFARVPDGAAYAEWDEPRRQAFLESELLHPRPFAEATTTIGEEADAVLATYRAVAEHVRRHGRGGIGALIVSMTRSLSDLLGVYLLGRESGLVRPGLDGLTSILPVVPLFETWSDLAAAPSILDSFLSHPITRRSLPFQQPAWDAAASSLAGGLPCPDPQATAAPTAKPGKENRVQWVMIGYSDSNKDAGILASQWGLFSTQVALSRTGRAHGIDIRFFHGRGGTVSRGAGPTHRFLDALPAGTLDAGLRITEQGEVIAQKYNNPLTAALNLELIAAGALRNRLMPASKEGSAALEPLLPALAQRSTTAYRELLETPGFVDFYRSVTPIDVIEQCKIGSRPSRRTRSHSLATLRAIPWVFSWTQARFYLSGWYGVGSALLDLQQNRPADFETLRAGWQDWTFLRYLVLNLESSLESASEDWMQAYASLVQPAELRERFMSLILEEFRLSRRMLAELAGGSLPDRRPRFFKTLHSRDAGLALLHAEQIRLLRAWRDQPDDQTFRRLLFNVNAIASGLRTTG